MEVINNEEKNRFELEVDGHLAIIEYQEKDGNIALTSTQVPDTLSGRGIGKELVSQVVAQIEKTDLKIIPVCSFIQAWFKRNPDKGELLA
jgi:uncharacterized protein